MSYEDLSAEDRRIWDMGKAHFEGIEKLMMENDPENYKKLSLTNSIDALEYTYCSAFLVGWFHIEPAP